MLLFQDFFPVVRSWAKCVVYAQKLDQINSYSIAKDLLITFRCCSICSMPRLTKYVSVYNDDCIRIKLRLVLRLVLTNPQSAKATRNIIKQTFAHSLFRCFPHFNYVTKLCCLLRNCMSHYQKSFNFYSIS